jgi:hypothetical protein
LKQSLIVLPGFQRQFDGDGYIFASRGQL